MAALTLRLSEGTFNVMTNSNLLAVLQSRGYEPQFGYDTSADIFDLTASGIGTIRVMVFASDGGRVELHRFNRRMAGMWDAQFSNSTPDAVIIAAIDAAESQLTAERGGPVR